MGQFLKAAKIQDIPEGKGVVSNLDGTPVAIFHVSGKFHAISNTCAHRGGPLSEGECAGPVVTCPWHGWQYDVTSGCSPENPKVKVASFPLKVEGDDVWVEV